MAYIKNVKLTPDMAAKLKQQAKDRGLSANAIVILALEGLFSTTSQGQERSKVNA